MGARLLRGARSALGTAIATTRRWSSPTRWPRSAGSAASCSPWSRRPSSRSTRRRAAWWSSALAALTSIVLRCCIRPAAQRARRVHAAAFAPVRGVRRCPGRAEPDRLHLRHPDHLPGDRRAAGDRGRRCAWSTTGCGRPWCIVAIDVVWILCAVAWGIPVPPATFVSQIQGKRAGDGAEHRPHPNRAAVRAGPARGPPDGDHRRIDRSGQPARTARSCPGTTRQAAGQPLDLAVVYVDVDGLKTVNDTLWSCRRRRA